MVMRGYGSQLWLERTGVLCACVESEWKGLGAMGTREG